MADRRRERVSKEIQWTNNRLSQINPASNVNRVALHKPAPVFTIEPNARGSSHFPSLVSTEPQALPRYDTCSNSVIAASACGLGLARKWEDLLAEPKIGKRFRLSMLQRSIDQSSRFRPNIPKSTRLFLPRMHLAVCSVGGLSWVSKWRLSNPITQANAIKD